MINPVAPRGESYQGSFTGGILEFWVHHEAMIGQFKHEAFIIFPNLQTFQLLESGYKNFLHNS